MPSIGILPARNVPGASSLDSNAQALTFVPLEEALNIEWETDAHAVQYCVAQGEQVVPSPRLLKDIVPSLHKAGAEAYVTWFGIDIDMPEHMHLTPETYQHLEDYLASHLTPFLQQFAAYYTTRAGVRFVYVLKDPIPVSYSDRVQMSLIKMFHEAGLNADTHCADWTRLFRLPKVMREGEAQGNRPFDCVQLNPGALLDASQIPLIDSAQIERTAAAPALDEPMPDDSLENLTEEIGYGGNTRQTRWFKDAKKRLRNRMSYACVFENSPLAERGGRDQTIQKYVGEACALLSTVSGTTAQHIFALFLPSIQRLEPDKGTPDWRVPLWRAICRYWPKEQAKAEAEAGQPGTPAWTAEQQAFFEQRQANAAVKWETIIAGMRQWNKALEGLDDNQAMDYIRRRAILAASGQYFLLTPHGKYDTQPVVREHLIARIRQLQMDDVIPTFHLTPKGIADKSIQGIMNEFVSAGYELDGIVDGRDGIVEGQKLLKTLFTRKPDMQPEYNRNVDNWLRVFAGPQYDTLCNWIGLALAWDEGSLCALSIKGPPDSGKKLLVRGLVECVSTEEHSDATEFSRFKSGIMRSPFLVVNEGFPDRRHMTMDPADTFRSFVSGDPVRIEEKFQVPITVRNPLRIIFTTNNDDIIRTLSGGRDLTPYDREAISQRLFHIDIPQETPRWLAEQGNRRFTARWIRGDSGEASGFVVARHFMWLYAQRHAGSGRFLMDGTNNERIIKAMTLRSGAAPIVFEILTRLIESANKQKIAAVIEDKHIFVTENLIEDYEKTYNNGRRAVSNHIIRNVLAAMRAPGTEPIQTVKGTTVGDRKLAVWHEMNAKLILDEAIERGLPCQTLQRVLGMIPDELPASFTGHPAAQAR